MASALRLLRRSMSRSRADVQRGIGVVDPDGDKGAGGLLDSVAVLPEGRCSFVRAMKNRVLLAHVLIFNYLGRTRRTQRVAC